MYVIIYFTYDIILRYNIYYNDFFIEGLSKVHMHVANSSTINLTNISIGYIVYYYKYLYKVFTMLFYKLSRQDHIMIKEQKSLSIIQHTKNSAQMRNFKKEFEILSIIQCAKNSALLRNIKKCHCQKHTTNTDNH